MSSTVPSQPLSAHAVEAGRQGEGRAHGELRIGERMADHVTHLAPLGRAEVAQQRAAESYRAGVRVQHARAAGA